MPGLGNNQIPFGEEPDPILVLDNEVHVLHHILCLSVNMFQGNGEVDDVRIIRFSLRQVSGGGRGGSFSSSGFLLGSDRRLSSTQKVHHQRKIPKDTSWLVGIFVRKRWVSLCVYIVWEIQGVDPRNEIKCIPEVNLAG